MKGVIVIPCLHEHDTLHELLPKLKQSFPKWKILLIDDSEKFETKEFESDIVSCLSVFRGKSLLGLRKKRFGYAKSLILGLKTATYVLHGDFIIQMDADHNPSDIKELTKFYNEETYKQNVDVVIGREQMTKTERRFKSELASLLARKLLGFNIHQPTCGLRLFTRKAIKSLQLDRIKSKGFEVQIEMIWQCKENNLNVQETWIGFHRRQFGKSKMKLKYIRWFLSRLFRLTTKHIYLKLRYKIFRG